MSGKLNNVNPNQTPHSLTSDLGLHYLLRSVGPMNVAGPFQLPVAFFLKHCWMNGKQINPNQTPCSAVYDMNLNCLHWPFDPISTYLSQILEHFRMLQYVFYKKCKPFIPSGLFHHYRSISNRGRFWLVFVLPCLIEIPIFNVNIADLIRRRILWHLI